jgi:hypothetical protein
VIDGVPVDPSLIAFAGSSASAAAGAVSVRFEYSTPIFRLERTVTLHQGSPVFDIALTMSSVLPHAISSVRFDQLPAGDGAVEVDRYVGGSDWRDDFRVVTAATGSFDAEGEVAASGGFFLVTERRGGAMSRVGRDAAGLWGGVDWARDLADLGPIQSESVGPVTVTDPNSNRVENPAYPVPVRARRTPPNAAGYSLGRVASGLVCDEDPQAAAATYASWLAGVREPAFPRQVTLNSFHPWGHSAEFNEQTILAQAQIAAQLGIDTIILDDQWQGGPGGESGDWRWDRKRFPDGPGVVKKLASMGLRTGLWMSPAEFNKASQTFKAHPTWACTPTGTVTSRIPDDAGLGVWDLNQPAVRAYLTSVIDRIVNVWGVHYFKFDFQTWVDCPPHDYNDYEQAFVGWVDGLEAEHPDVTFEFDETNDQRMWAFESAARGPSWFDNGHDHTDQNGNPVLPPAQILHDVWSAAPWIPSSTIGAGLYDDDVLSKGYSVDYLMPIAALTHITFWTDLTKLTDAQRSETAWWLAWYHQNASTLAGAVYNLTSTSDAADPRDDVQAAAFQTWDAAGDGGFLFAFRQSGDAPIVSLHGLAAGHTYTLTDVRTGAVLGTFTSAQLSGGVAVPLPSAHTAAVYRIAPA